MSKEQENHRDESFGKKFWESFKRDPERHKKAGDRTAVAMCFLASLYLAGYIYEHREAVKQAFHEITFTYLVKDPKYWEEFFGR